MPNDLRLLTELLRDGADFQHFNGLSEVLVDPGPQPAWLARAYYVTLVAGALSAEDFSGPEGLVELGELAWSFLMVDRMLSDHSLLDRETTLGQVRPTPGYTPQYTLEQVQQTLDEYAAIVASNPPDLAAAVKARILENPTLAPVARSISCLWYTAGLLDLSPSGMGYPTKTAPIPAYASALVWKALGGQAMGITGPYYGNWAYPSPQPILPPTGLRAPAVSRAFVSKASPASPPIGASSSRRGR